MSTLASLVFLSLWASFLSKSPRPCCNLSWFITDAVLKWFILSFALRPHYWTTMLSFTCEWTAFHEVYVLEGLLKFSFNCFLAYPPMYANGFNTISRLHNSSLFFNVENYDLYWNIRFCGWYGLLFNIGQKLESTASSSSTVPRKSSSLTRLVLASAYHLRNALQPCCHDSLRSEIF